MSLNAIYKKPQIAIVGAGSVGSSIAHSIILKNISCDIKLIDVDESKSIGNVLDLNDITYSSSTNISLGELKDCNNSEIVILTAGAKQKKGETRDDLIVKNKQIIQDIFKQLGDVNKNSIWILVSNPVETLTFYTQLISKLNKNQVIGSGTFLDTTRLKNTLSNKLKINKDSININIIGEHGDEQVVCWNASSISGKNILEYDDSNELKNLQVEVKNKAYKIIDCKGFTNFGISSCISSLVNCILNDLRIVYPVSCYSEKHEIYMSLPAIIGRNGVEKILEVDLNNEEEIQLQKSINKMKKLQTK